jgi:hypothetical protein
MITIFEEEGEPLTERAKVEELLTKVHSTALSVAVASLRFQLNTDGVTFTRAANHLTAEVTQSSDYQLARKISASGPLEDVVRVAAAVEAIKVVVNEAVEVVEPVAGMGAVKNEVPLTIPPKNGKSCHTKSGTRFVRTVIKRESKAEPSEMFRK